MTQIKERPVASAAETVERWLAAFNGALEEGDTAAVSELFLETSFWRDLVALTWNLTTVENPDGIRAMLDATLAHSRPHGFRTTEPATETEGVIEAWIEFETGVGRGNGLLPLRDGKAWTLLTELYELKGHEERRADKRPKGTEHGAFRDRETWLDRRVR